MNSENPDTQPIQFPEVWTRERIRIAIDELDSCKLTYNERVSLEMFIERKAYAFYAEEREMQEALDLQKTEMIKRGLVMGLKVEQCADIVDVPADFVLSIQQQLSASH